jgi:hypothetical protein
MNKLVSIIGLAAVSASLGMMAACSSSSSTDTGGTDAGGLDSSATDSGGSTDSGSGTDSGGGDQACAAMATAKACEQCCAGNHTTGATTLTKTVIACSCNGVGETGDAGADGGDGGSGPCASACAATLCATTPQQPDTACQTCSQASVSAGGACANYLSTQCQADTDCVAEQTCFQSCPK